MTRAQPLKVLSFGGPATYRVVIQGEVSQNWVRRLAGMAVTTTSREGDAPRTILQGRIPDQSALRGVLETLYALHLSILEVREVDAHLELEGDERDGEGDDV